MSNNDTQDQAPKLRLGITNFDAAHGFCIAYTSAERATVLAAADETFVTLTLTPEQAAKLRAFGLDVQP